MAIRFLIVDGFNLIRRIFEVSTKSGSQRGIQETVSVAQASLQRAITRYTPTHAAVVLEHHDPTWRHLLYPEYKANRSPTPALLLQHLDDFAAAFQQLGVATTAIPSYEADDVVATMATVVSSRKGEAIILSTDRTYLQLLSTGIRQFDHFADREFKPIWVQQQYGVDVARYVDYLALVGDKSNNIKGVPGIGGKTAAALLGRHGSLQQILTAGTDDTRQGKLLAKVQTAAVVARRCQQLVCLKCDVELDQNLKHFRLGSTSVKSTVKNES